MLQQVREYFVQSRKRHQVAYDFIDENLAVAALMVHVIVADGVIREEEIHRFKGLLGSYYNLSADEVDELHLMAEQAQKETVGLREFTNVLKKSMNDMQKLVVLEQLWHIVYADAQLHEHEDNVVWRVADLLGVNETIRLALQKKVLAQLD